MKWKQFGRNMVLDGGEDFFVSYNPDTGSSPVTKLLTDIGNALGGNLHDGEETALVKRGESDNTYYILEGDYRKDYEKRIGDGFDACLQFYNKKKKRHGSNWSTNASARR